LTVTLNNDPGLIHINLINMVSTGDRDNILDAFLGQDYFCNRQQAFCKVEIGIMVSERLSVCKE